MLVIVCVRVCVCVRLAGLSWRKNYSDWDPAAQTAGSPGQMENRQAERERQVQTETEEDGQAATQTDKKMGR